MPLKLKTTTKRPTMRPKIQVDLGYPPVTDKKINVKDFEDWLIQSFDQMATFFDRTKNMSSGIHSLRTTADKTARNVNVWLWASSPVRILLWMRRQFKNWQNLPPQQDYRKS